MELGKQIYELRKKANLSQEQLAEKVGVSRQTISKWELGETAPDIKQAQVLSQVFSVSLDELTGNDTKEVIYEKVSNTEKLAYLIAFFSLWALVELVLFEKITSVVGNGVLSEFIREGVIKNLVWTVPAGVLIYRFKDEVLITLKEMFSSKVNWLKYLPVFIIFTIYLLGGAILQNGKLTISNNFGFENVISLLFVGLTEELVFRGWLLNLTVKENKKWISICINALLFLVIHFQIWIQEGVFISNFTSFGFLSILILSVIFSWTFIKSRNILVPIALHTYWNLLIDLFF